MQEASVLYLLPLPANLLPFSVTYCQICVTHVENHLNLKRNRKDNFTSILITFFSLIAKEFEKRSHSSLHAYIKLHVMSVLMDISALFEPT